MRCEIQLIYWLFVVLHASSIGSGLVEDGSESSVERMDATESTWFNDFLKHTKGDMHAIFAMSCFDTARVMIAERGFE